MNDTPKVVDPIDECVRLGRENAELQAALKCEREWVLALTKDNGLLLQAADSTKAGALAVRQAGRIEQLEEDKEHLRGQLREANRLLVAFAPESARAAIYAAIDADRKDPNEHR